MPISFDAAFGPHPAALALRAERMGVLASNIAHADTPGYQARDIDFKSVLAQRLTEQDAAGRKVRSWRTNAAHLPNPVLAEGAAVKYRQPWMPSPDSNTVDVQVEQGAMAENNIQWQAAYRFLNGKISALRTAIQGE